MTSYADPNHPEKVEIVQCARCKRRPTCDWDDYSENWFVGCLHPGGQFCEEPWEEGTWSGPNAERKAVIKKWNLRQINNRLTNSLKEQEPK